MIQGIEHVGVLAKDTAALRDWYNRLFGFRTVYDNGKGTYFIMAPDGSMLELIKEEEAAPAGGLKTGGLRHLALKVTDTDFEPLVAQLKKEQVVVVTDAAVSSSGVKTFFFRDPEGNILHLISRPKPLG